MPNLTRAHKELFRRSPDECFDSMEALRRHCQQQKNASVDRWHEPQALSARPDGNRLLLDVGRDGSFQMNDWSFSQLCSLARVTKDTVNRLSPETAGQVFRETLPTGNKPLQLLTSQETVRSIHGMSYTRLWNADLLNVVEEFASDFQPPQKAAGGGTGLYAGEQDCFLFEVDPCGWVEINGEAFAPGYFAWNSEVGKRSVGIQTFWFQQCCANHIVWDATETVEVSRKHTANVHDALTSIRQTLEKLVGKRDQRRDGFARVMQKAMLETLGTDAEEAGKMLAKAGIKRELARKALAIAEEQGRFTIFSVVDALTRLAGQIRYAGDRLEVDQKASSLLNLVATAA